MKKALRVVIVGTTGAGKTTFARELSIRSGLPHTELDSLYWGPEWKPVQASEFRERLTTLTQRDRWIIEGDYDRGREILWARAERIIWLDLPLFVVFARTLRRTVVRAITREKLWAGNQESLMQLFASRDSLLIWVVRSYFSRRKKFAAAMKNDPRWIRLRSESDRRRCLELLSGDSEEK